MAKKRKIICPKCKAKLKFDPDKFSSKVVKFKCPGCGSVLRIRNTGRQEEPLSDAAARQAESMIKRPESRLETEQSVGVEPPVSGKTEEIPAPKETRPEEKYSPSIPEDRPDLPKEPSGSAAWDPGYDDLNELESRYETEAAAGVEPAVSEKIEGEAPAAQETLPEEKYSPPIPEYKPVVPEFSEESHREDFAYEGLKGPESRSETDTAAGVEPTVPEKIGEEAPAAQETVPEENRVVCQNCKAMLKFDPDRIISEVVKAKCPGCGSLIIIRKPGAQIEPSPSPTAASKSESAIETRPDTEDLREPESGPETETAAGVEPTVPEKIEEETPTVQETVPEENRVVCQNCQVMLKFDPARITSEVVKAKCPGCGSLIIIRKPGAPIEPSPSPTEQASEPVPSPISDKTETEAPASEETQPPATHGPLIPEDKLVGPKKEDRASLLEDFDSDKLKEYEEGEAEEGDLEWTRYAEKGPKLPESTIDLDVIPAAADALYDTLADLQRAEMYNFQGENHLKKNRAPQAIRDFNNALEINPDYVDALVNRGSAFALQNDFNAALNDFNHALELETKQAEIYNIRGEIYLLNSMYDEAIRDFTAAIMLNPVFSDAYLNRAKAYNEKGMTEEAKNDFNQAIRADADKFPDYVDLAGTESLFDDESTSVKEKAEAHVHQGRVELKN